jgi:hypothetical protein
LKVRHLPSLATGPFQGRAERCRPLNCRHLCRQFTRVNDRKGHIGRMTYFVLPHLARPGLFVFRGSQAALIPQGFTGGSC